MSFAELDATADRLGRAWCGSRSTHARHRSHAHKLEDSASRAIIGPDDGSWDVEITIRFSELPGLIESGGGDLARFVEWHEATARPTAS